MSKCPLLKLKDKVYLYSNYIINEELSYSFKAYEVGTSNLVYTAKTLVELQNLIDKNTKKSVKVYQEDSSGIYKASDVVRIGGILRINGWNCLILEIISTSKSVDSFNICIQDMTLREIRSVRIPFDSKWSEFVEPQ